MSSITLASPRLSLRAGATYLLMGQVTFLFTSYILHIFLGRYLGPVEYGLFGIAIYASNIMRAFVSVGLPLALTRYVSAEPEQAENIFRTGWRLQLFIALAVSAVVFISAGWLAALLGDPRLASLFRLVAPLTIFFGLFFYISQYYNGLRDYRRQALLLIQSYWLRALLVIALVLLGCKAFGAVAGVVTASAISLAWAMTRRSVGQVEGRFPAAELIRFSWPLIVAALAQALIMDMDIMFVKKFAQQEAQIGFYASAKTLAQVNTFVFYALSGALYPAVSAASASANWLLLTNYVRQAHRWLLLVILPICIITWRESEGLIWLFYGSAYSPAATTLPWLAISFSLLSIFVIHQTIITGCGYPRVAGIITVALLPLGFISQSLLTPQLGLTGAAVAAGGTVLIGVLITTGYLVKKFGQILNLRATLRILMATAGLWICDLLLQSVDITILIKLPLLIAVFFMLLYALGEFRDLNLKDFLKEFTPGA